MKVLVVGLNPSKKHGNSPTLKNLNNWLDRLNLGPVSFINLYEGYEINESEKTIQFIKNISKDYDRVIALGNEVSRNLSSSNIGHFKLPHPSGLNRLLNDSRYVREKLEDCKRYLHEGSNEIL